MLSRFFLCLAFGFILMSGWQTDVRLSKELDKAECTPSSRDDREDEELSNQFGVITGQVTVMDAKTKEVVIPSWQPLIFQRMDCKKCIFTVRTDKTGKYQIIIGQGKYRVITRYGTRMGETYDAIAPDQPRTVEVKAGPLDTTFDIRLVRQPTQLDEKIQLQEKSP